MMNGLVPLLRGCFCFLIFALSYFIVEADRTNQKIYINLSGNMPCFRRLNATHQTGCASKRGGNVGTLHYIQHYDDLTNLLANGTNYPFIIAIKPIYFAKKMLNDMRESSKVNGVLLLYPNDTLDTEFLDHFSPDQKCPNMNYGVYRNEWQNMSCPFDWNPSGNNILFEDWGFPIFLIKENEDMKHLNDCYYKFNSPSSGKADKWPFCAAELRSNMLAAKDTKTCMRRSKLETNLNPTVICDPLGDQNIWSTLLPTNKSNPLPKKSLIIVAAKLDAASEFDNFSPGAHTTVTGLVTLLAVAEALSKFKDKFTEQSNVMFILFNGESFDYIGSSRVVYDMERDTFPVKLNENIQEQPALIKMENIAHFIEISQLSQKDTPNATFIHLDPISNIDQDVQQSNDKLVDVLSRQAQRNNINLERTPGKPQPLPSASLQSFLRASNISGAVIADHDQQYINLHYNSIADDWSKLNASTVHTSLQQYLAKIASTIAGAVYALATNENITITVEESRINDFLVCYLNNSDCKLFQESVNPAKSAGLPSKSFPLYVSVANHINALTSVTLRVLALTSGERLENTTKNDCHGERNNQIFRYFWMKGPVSNLNESGGVCVKTTGNYSTAISPAFEIDDYDFDSGVYSSWTESVWEATSVRIFVKPSDAWEYTVLSTGLFVCLISFVVVWFVNRNAAILFSHSQIGC